MGYFNRDSNNRSGRDNRGGGRGFSGGRNDGPREMFKTVCSSCGKECEVPFKPTNGKPVYCSECFDRISPRNDARPERNRSNFDSKPFVPKVDNSAQLEVLGAKLDKIIELLTPKVEEVVIEEVKLPKTPKIKKTKVVKK
ncbi:MAG: hypothetical protein ACD_19C00182G0009 [uncultured bacterium]|nr:MAG: hypothetical protein ACD_19C00182G0009 [uncultured bacterium]